MKPYVSIFLRTAGGLALTILVAAQAWEWTDESIVPNAQKLGFALAVAAVGGLIAVAWAFIGTPAVTPLGKALRQGVQALVASPLVVLLSEATGIGDLSGIGDMIVPTLSAVVLAFLISFGGNRAPAPNVASIVPSATKSLGSDLLGKAA